MENIENMYIVKLLTASLNNVGRFRAKDQNWHTYNVSPYFYENNRNILSDLVNNDQSKYAVIIDEEGTDIWEGTTFRNIQFISSSEEICKKYISLKTRKDKILYDRMAHTETLIERANLDSSEVERLNKEIAKLEEQLSVIARKLEELN